MRKMLRLLGNKNDIISMINLINEL